MDGSGDHAGRDDGCPDPDLLEAIAAGVEPDDRSVMTGPPLDATPRPLPDIVSEQARARPDAPAIETVDGSRWSFAELEAFSSRLAGRRMRLRRRRDRRLRRARRWSSTAAGRYGSHAGQSRHAVTRHRAPHKFAQALDGRPTFGKSGHRAQAKRTVTGGIFRGSKNH